MAKLTTTNFEAGEPTNRTATNTKFSAVQTATQTINEENVRSEAIDRRQLQSPRQEPIVYVAYDDRAPAAATTHAAQTGATHVELSNVAINPVAPQPIVTAGDLVRIHFTAFLHNIDDPDYATYGAAGTAATSGVNPADAIGVVFFPTWQLSGGGALVPLPNEASWTASLVAPANITIDSSNNKSDSIAFCSMEGAPLGGGCQSLRQVHGCWNYKHTGASITIHGLRLNFRGPMAYRWDPAGAGSRVFHAPVWGTGQYGNLIMDIPGTPTVAGQFVIQISNAQLSLMIMRGDS
jgi:hypothetical protein